MKETDAFYKTKAWKKCRAACVKRARGLCEHCLAKGLYIPGVIVHHKTHITPENMNDPAITLNADNLVLLCRECHGVAHKNGNRRYLFDESGNIVMPPH